MREVVYRTETFDRQGVTLNMVEYSACFNTPSHEHTDMTSDKLAKQLYPTKETAPLTQEQVNTLKSRKPDYTLLTAVLSPCEPGYVIDAMYEKELQ